MLNYQYRTKPFAHQIVALEKSCDAEFFGLLMEQRTGKSKVVIDNAAMLHRDGKINCLIVIAPNGVHRNWVDDEFPTHMPKWCEYKAVYWTPSGTKKKAKELDSLFNAGHHLRIFTINFEAVITKRGYEFLRRLINATDAMLAIDESTRIKNPKSATTLAIMKLRDHVNYRRILNGTPITQSPLDAYSQLLFLDDYAVPIQSYVGFKARYAVFADPSQSFLVQKIVKDNLRRANKFDALEKLETGELSYDDEHLKRWVPDIPERDAEGRPIYKNLDELKEWVDKCCYRVLRKDCADLPEKIYKRWRIDLSAEQEKTVRYWLHNMKEGLTPEPISKMVQVQLYQRLLCGTVPKQLTGLPEHTPMYTTPKDNPRIQAILQIIDAYPNASIVVWARFRIDLHEITEAIREHTEEPVARYWGDIGGNERAQAKADFQAKRVKYFVGQQGAGGVGLPLHAADILLYHSNTFSLYHRLQSEDRAENMQKTTATMIIDLEVFGTCDTKIITSLRAKRDVADMITGDENTDWLSFDYNKE